VNEFRVLTDYIIKKDEQVSTVSVILVGKYISEQDANCRKAVGMNKTLTAERLWA
jgi:hypothetical protein